MEGPTFTIYFRGGPLHGQIRTSQLGCGAVARVGERYTVGIGLEKGLISRIHEYEFTHVQGPLIVAQFVETRDMPELSRGPSWGPWQKPPA